MNMVRPIFRTNTAHPEIVYLFRDLSNVHAELRSVQKRIIIRKKSFEMWRVICWHTSVAQRELSANNYEVTEILLELVQLRHLAWHYSNS